MGVNSLLFPGVSCQNWQMMDWEKIALMGVLSRLRPKNSLEIGIYHGGSLSLTSQYVEKIYAIDIDPAVTERFQVPPNAEILIEDSRTAIPKLFEKLEREGQSLSFILIDADHSTEGVRRDIEAVLAYRPAEPLVLLIHDSGNPGCRKGIAMADWNANPHVHHVELDFVPAQIIESTVTPTSAEIWGGFALAYLDETTRDGPVVISAAANTGNASLAYACSNMQAIRPE